MQLRYDDKMHYLSNILLPYVYFTRGSESSAPVCTPPSELLWSAPCQVIFNPEPNLCHV